MTGWPRGPNVSAYWRRLRDEQAGWLRRQRRRARHAAHAVEALHAVYPLSDLQAGYIRDLIASQLRLVEEGVPLISG